tara:strand:+ start:466 stop:735 length:270 start_codon:yes stop_codon:yes gene_type:complete
MEQYLCMFALNFAVLSLGEKSGQSFGSHSLEYGKMVQSQVQALPFLSTHFAAVSPFQVLDLEDQASGCLSAKQVDFRAFHQGSLIVGEN